VLPAELPAGAAAETAVAALLTAADSAKRKERDSSTHASP
jgi:hypothetical protein